MPYFPLFYTDFRSNTWIVCALRFHFKMTLQKYFRSRAVSLSVSIVYRMTSFPLNHETRLLLI